MSDRASDPDGEQDANEPDEQVPGALLAVGIFAVAMLTICALIAWPPL